MKVAVAPAPLLAAIAVVAGAIVGVGLSLFGRPADADPRMAQIRDTMVQVRRLNSQPGAPGLLPLGAVCSGQPAKAAELYKAALSASAGRHKLAVGAISVTAVSAGAGDLTPLAVQWNGAGDYAAFVGVLSDLAAEKPTLFIEALDVKPQGSRAEFALKGKIWCWTPVANRS